ncbi:serine protease grass-like [Drosophila obscura]|uniref:serine protease grass-like n=1 Tax=Drosophila obscura TaxID=7282 RepID=UPI001BB291A1|nr:serine protease grass-like [Drosophila obscura]
MIALMLVATCLFLGGNGQLLEQDCGTTTSSRPMIFGGQDAAPVSHPWMAQIYGMGQFFCGGSLITQRFVLTAAHCYKPNVYLTVRLGDFDTRWWTPHQDYPVESTYIHPNYRTFDSYDIALIKLQSYVIYTDFIRPICILLNWSLQQKVDNFREFTLTGWGTMENGQIPSVLQTASLTQIDRTACLQSYGYQVNRLHICAGSIGTHACTGDSGGPLGTIMVYKGASFYTQFGIVSYGPKPCNGVSVFTNVLQFTPWIHYTIEQANLV